MNHRSNARNMISWIFSVVFFITGILNVFLVHIIPGVFYILLTFVYFPPATAFIEKKSGFSIPFIVKLILGLVILWGTLAVGELMEVLGSYI